MRAAVVVPAYQAAPTVGAVVRELCAIWPERDAIFVVDDGSHDATTERAAEAGATVLRHDQNRGKGAALATGMHEALRRGFEVSVTVDADGQHPPAEALRMHRSCTDESALVLGVRDLIGAGAPRPSQLSNRFSNLVLSGFTGHWLLDTQCGLRRYPLSSTLSLGARENGYGFEAEVIIRATAARIPIVQLPVDVIYPPAEERISHFHSVRDPARIVARVVQTVVSTRTRWLRDRVNGRAP
jgi:glycosyltransferase involved in cell wall biosynthesis